MGGSTSKESVARGQHIYFFNLALFEQLLAYVLPSPTERSSPIYSFQLVGGGKPGRAVPAPCW
jgi:hypothetical protein